MEKQVVKLKLLSGKIVTKPPYEPDSCVRRDVVVFYDLQRFGQDLHNIGCFHAQNTPVASQPPRIFLVRYS